MAILKLAIGKVPAAKEWDHEEKRERDWLEDRAGDQTPGGS